MTAVTAATQVDGENPWPGLESFEEDACTFFYGRDHEAESLFNHVLDAPVTVLYGRSGLGKTSLLRAGLFPKLRANNFLPVYVRLELDPGAAPLSRQLQQSVRDSIRADLPDAMLPSDEESLWEYLHRTDFELWSARNYPLVPVIVLDQFEELFTLGAQVPDLVREFRNDLGDLAENRIPPDLAARIDTDEVVAERFNLRSRNYKLLVSLREDFLPHLEGWCRLIPALGRSRERLIPLRVGQAFDAVHEPAADLITDELAHRVVDIIAGEDLHPGRDTALADVVGPGDELGAAEVEPALLSLFCRELNEERKRRGQPHFDEQLVEDAKRGILSNFYLSCVRDLPPRVADFIESKLISEKGFRNGYPREEAVPTHLTEDELAQLISSRLLRLEDRYGAQRIELTHDVLTGVVREHRDRRRAEDEKAALAAHAEQERQALEQAAAQREAELDLERERRLESERATRRSRKLSAVLAMVCVAAVVLTVVAWNLKQSAAAARAAAIARSREAVVQRLYADSQLMLAGLHPGDSDDTLAIQMLLAAHSIPSKQSADYPLLTALHQERDLLKVIDTPVLMFSVAFSPDGQRIVSGSDSVQQWDSRSGQSIGEPLRGHDQEVTSVAYSPDGTRIASGSWDHTVRLWDVTTGRPIGEPLRHDNSVTSVAFSSDGTRIASGSSDKTVRLWDVATGHQIGEPLRHDSSVMSVAYSPDGTRIASGGEDNTVRLWDTATGRPIGEPLRGHASGLFSAVTSVAFSPDGLRVVSGGDDGTVRVWDTATGQPIEPPLRGHDNDVTSVAYSPDGTRIASGSLDKTVRLWDAATAHPIAVLAGHDAAVENVAFSPDGLRVASGSDDGTVRVWDASSWQPLIGHDDMAWAEFSDDGRRIASGGADKTVRWWDAATGRPIGEPLSVDADNVRALFPLGENRVVSVGSTDTVRLWDAHTREPIGEPLRLPAGTEDWVNYDKSGRIAARTAPDTVQLWDIDMRAVGESITQEQTIMAMVFSSDGRILATGSTDWTVRLWDADTGKSIGKPMRGDGWVSSIAFSPDGHTLAVGAYDNTLRLWDTRTFQPVGEPMGVDSLVIAAAFSPDGQTVASGSADGTIRLWDAEDQTQLGSPLTGHTASVLSIDFSPDGTRLVSGSADHMLRVWPVLTPSPEALCAKITHNLSREQWDSWVSPDVEFTELCGGLPVSDWSGQR